MFVSSQIHETIETINQLKTQREFMLSFARDPQGFINDWLQSQCRDLKVSPSVVMLHFIIEGLVSAQIQHMSLSVFWSPLTFLYCALLNKGESLFREYSW